MDHARKALLSNTLYEMCQKSIYPPSCEMLKARVQPYFSDIEWSDDDLKRFIRNRLELFYGVGMIILKCLEEAVQKSVPYDILRLIVELRGKDIIFIEHRNCIRVALHLETVCREAGYETTVRVLKEEQEYMCSHMASNKSTESLKQLVVGYEFEDEVKPLYIAIPGQEYPVDVKMAWSILKGEMPSNVGAVKAKFYNIEEKLDQIYKHLGEDEGIEVQLYAPVNDKTSTDMTKTMQKVLGRNSSSFFTRLRNREKDESKATRTLDDSNDMARKFASAVCESEGFSSLKPVRRRGELLGIALFKNNTIYEVSPFWYELGVGRYLRDPRIHRFSRFTKGTWIYMLQHCRRQMAWYIWRTTENDRRKRKVPKNYVSIPEQRRAIKACLMSQRSKKQHGVKKNTIGEYVDERNVLDFNEEKENTTEETNKRKDRKESK